MNEKLLKYFEETVLPALEKVELPPVSIFIDDLRECPKGWMLFRTGEEFLEWRKANPDVVIDVIAFDHDLGEGVSNGYEIVQDMVELDSINTENIGKIIFHTDNLIGLKNMYFYLTNAQKHGMFGKNTVIESQKRNCIDGKFSFSPFKVAF